MISQRWRRIIEIAIIVIVAIAVQCLIIGHADAAEDSGSVIETIEDILTDLLGTDNRAPTPDDPTPYIYQGDIVYLDTTIDVSGLLPPYQMLAYWDGFDMYDSPPKYNLTLDDTKKAYYQFYVDPEIFASRPGKWYKWDGEYEKQGNNLAFIVSPYYFENYTLRYPNGTILNFTANLTVGEYVEHNITPPEPLPGKPVADYVLAKGDNFTWPAGGYHLWLFGTHTGIYDHPDGYLTPDEVQTLQNGKYTIGIQFAGNNTIYEAEYRNDTLYPGLYGKAPVNVAVFNKSPVLMQEAVHKMLDGTDDILEEYQMDLDIPYITIRQADEVIRENLSYLDVRGYTNVANGTGITVTLDEKDRRDYKGEGIAVRTSPGNLSSYRALVPIYYDELAADARNHTLTARTAIGGSAEKDFKISVMPADSYRPNASLKYIEDRNPFVATPTPQVVTQVVTQVVKEYVTVEVTPPPSMVYEQQKKAVDAKWGETFQTVGTIGIMLVGAVGFFGIGYYLMSVHWRARKQKKLLEDLKRRYGNE